MIVHTPESGSQAQAHVRKRANRGELVRGKLSYLVDALFRAALDAIPLGLLLYLLYLKYFTFEAAKNLILGHDSKKDWPFRRKTENGCPVPFTHGQRRCIFEGKCAKWP